MIVHHSRFVYCVYGGCKQKHACAGRSAACAYEPITAQEVRLDGMRVGRITFNTPSLLNMATRGPNGDFPYLPSGAAEGK